MTTITDMTNLWVGSYDDDNFKVLICAPNEQEAKRAAMQFGKKSGMEDTPQITQFDNIGTPFNCDYVVTAQKKGEMT